jgi:hypothetical protein
MAQVERQDQRPRTGSTDLVCRASNPVSERATMATTEKSVARRMAVARPMPRLAPVTKATRPASNPSSIMMILSG